MVKLSETAEELISAFKGRVDQHTCLGLMFILRESDSNYREMLRYLEWNPYATQTDIMQEHRRILGLAPYQLKPRHVLV